MAEEKKGIYIGIDINDKNTLVSYYNSTMKEPETISTVLGEENYAIPTMVAKKKGMNQWFFGEEAKRRVAASDAVPAENLYKLALEGDGLILDGERFDARDLLVIFFKKIFSIPGYAYSNAPLEKLIICVEQVNLEIMELFNYIASMVAVTPGKLMLIDHRESFYYYALNQDPGLFQYDVALFDYSGVNMMSYILNRNKTTRPQIININQINHGVLSDRRDENFDNIVASTFGNSIISSCYLVGEGFEGDWMKTSLARVCRGRKAFLGQNLYSKGACYAGFVKNGNRDWPFIYIGDNELKLNLSLKVLDNNELKFFSLIDAGMSWYDASGECEVILDGEPDIEFWIQRPESREAHVEVLELTDLPKRENRTTRLRITALPKSDRQILITIKDLGFGEISASSGKKWEHLITLE